jgi:hypothetical protein
MTKIRTGLGGTIAVACNKYPRLGVKIMEILQASTSDQVYRGNWQADQIQQITDCVWEILVGKPKTKHDVWMARISKTVKFITIEIMQASLGMRGVLRGKQAQKKWNKKVTGGQSKGIVINDKQNGKGEDRSRATRSYQPSITKYLSGVKSTGSAKNAQEFHSGQSTGLDSTKETQAVV